MVYLSDTGQLDSFLYIWNKFVIMSFIFDYGPFSFPPSFSGLKQSEAESCYINIARTLEFYGVELHSGRVCLHCDFSLGEKDAYLI